VTNSNRFLVGRMALVIWVSGCLVVLGGCASKPRPNPKMPAQMAFESKLACLDKAYTDHEAHLAWVQQFVKAHPEITAQQAADLWNEEPGALNTLPGMTWQEKYAVYLRVHDDKHRVERCEETFQSVMKGLQEMDRDFQRQQPQYLYIVPPW